MIRKNASWLILAGSVSISHAGLYSIELLPERLGDTRLSFSSINDNGVVAGESLSGTSGVIAKQIVTYRRDQGVAVVIDNLHHDYLSRGVHINNSGQIAYTHNLRPGVAYDLVRTYRYTPGVGSEMMAPPNPNLAYTPISMNNRGDIVVQAATPDGWFQNSVIWRQSQGSEVLNGSYWAFSIEDNRTIVGATPISGFVRRNGESPILVHFPTTSGAVYHMNNSGRVFGAYRDQAGVNRTWIWDADLQGHTETPTDGGFLLDDGSITGAALRGSPRNQSLGRWTSDRGFEEITQMLDSGSLAHGFDRWFVYDVNQRGEILASAWTHDPNNQFAEPRFNVILRPHPVPEPGTVFALGAGLAALLRRRRAT